MGAISDIYRGKLSAPTEITVNAAEFDALSKHAEQLFESLKKQLSEDAAKDLEELVDIHHQMEAISSEDSYTKGFRNGAAIMLDALNK